MLGRDGFGYALRRPSSLLSMTKEMCSTRALSADSDAESDLAGYTYNNAPLTTC